MVQTRKVWKIIVKAAKLWEFNLRFKHIGGKRESGLSTPYDISLRNYFALLTDSIKNFGFFFLSILIVSNDHIIMRKVKIKS